MKLLLAEDDKELSNSIVRVLKFNEYDVDQAFDGQEALDYLEYVNYDLLILDVMMPKLDGISVVKRLREKGNNIPVLMLTALGDINDKVNGLDSGADDYLTKPFVIKELMARIRALVRRSDKVILETSKIGELELDKNNFEIKYKDKSERLTAKEFKLMELLIKNQNMLISTEKIMEEIWDIDSDAEINVVWVFISALRKKLQSINANYEIKAVRGVGYRLEEIKWQKN